MLKILQARLKQYMKQELSDVHARFRKGKEKGKETRDQIVNIHWIIEKKTRKFQQNIYFCFIEYGKPFDDMDHRKL